MRFRAWLSAFVIMLVASVALLAVVALLMVIDRLLGSGWAIAVFLVLACAVSAALITADG